MEHLVLDACCGSRMFWFDKLDRRAVFMDERACQVELCDNRIVSVKPDVQASFTQMPFPDNTFSCVVFDPPHLNRAGPNSWLRAKYGVLPKDQWPLLLASGFSECFRVLKPGGTLIFKWCEDQITLSKVLALTPQKPLVGHKTGKSMGTHWVLFIKAEY